MASVYVTPLKEQENCPRSPICTPACIQQMDKYKKYGEAARQITFTTSDPTSDVNYLNIMRDLNQASIALNRIHEGVIPAVASGPPEPLVMRRSPSPEEIDTTELMIAKLQSDQRISDRVAQVRKEMDSRRADAMNMSGVNEATLEKFSALNVNGQGLDKYTIGGYSLDIDKVTKKTQSLAPLPPVKLPVIFTDPTLNFYHHFFEGFFFLNEIDIASEIDSTMDICYDSALIVGTRIKELIFSGKEEGDDEVAIFVKRVLRGTFEDKSNSEFQGNEHKLIVAANLFGFQYIESGMELSTLDIGLWLTSCYSYYRALWYNTFKSTNLPSFAIKSSQGNKKLLRSKTYPLTQMESEKRSQPRMFAEAQYVNNQLEGLRNQIEILSYQKGSRSEDRRAHEKRRTDKNHEKQKSRWLK